MHTQGDGKKGAGAPHVPPQKISKHLVIKMQQKHKNSRLRPPITPPTFSQPTIPPQKNLETAVHS
jgi:hypothetical protein